MRHDAAFFLQNEGVEMTPEQVTQLRQVCSDNAATVQALTEAAKTPGQPGYPDLQTLYESLETQTDAVKFATYVYNGLDGLAAELAPSIIGPVAVTGKRYTELGIITAFGNPADGEACLQKLEAAAQSNPLLARMLEWLGPGNPGLDFGVQSLRDAITACAAANVITTTERDVLLSLGTGTITVHSSEIKGLR